VRKQFGKPGFFQVAFPWQIRAPARGETRWRSAYYLDADSFGTRDSVSGDRFTDLPFNASIVFVWRTEYRRLALVRINWSQ
jgi:hypothetical protein